MSGSKTTDDPLVEHYQKILNLQTELEKTDDVKEILGAGTTG